MKTMTLTQRAEKVANSCRDAYSVRRYRSWTSVAKALLTMGYNEAEAEGIMRSKWTRWAADMHGAANGKVPGKAIVKYIESEDPEYIIKNVAEFVAEG